MIEGLKPYPTYKDSGVPWLGQVPSHWEVVRLKYVLREVDRRSKTGDEQLLRVSQYTGVTQRHRLSDDVQDTRATSLVGYKCVEPSDLVINIMLAWNGSLGVSAYSGIVSPAYCVYRFRNGIYPRYFHNLLRLPAYKGRIKTASRGVVESRLRLYSEDLYRIEALCPPRDEQDMIMRFVDHVDKSVGRYIAAKRKLIRLLEEEKQAIVHHVVTRGLDPNVRLKPSGIAWLGEVPEHWMITRLKNEFLCLNSRRVPLSSTVRGGMTIRRYDYYGASGVIDKVDDFIFEDELLLLAEDGANLVLRNLPLAIIAQGRFWVNNHAHILKPKVGDIRYFAALLEGLSYLPWITGAAQPKLTKDRLLAIEIVVPPPEEQVAIVSWADHQTKPLQIAMDLARTEISLLTELRARVITDVVTGKLDVREAAAALADERLPEPEDDMTGVEEDDAEPAEELEEDAA